MSLCPHRLEKWDLVLREHSSKWALGENKPSHSLLSLEALLLMTFSFLFLNPINIMNSPLAFPMDSPSLGWLPSKRNRCYGNSLVSSQPAGSPVLSPSHLIGLRFLSTPHEERL